MKISKTYRIESRYLALLEAIKAVHPETDITATSLIESAIFSLACGWLGDQRVCEIITRKEFQ